MSKTALIVDDSRSARIVLKKMLEAHELGVDTAESAEDALVYLNDHRPDVIFMDHLMPGMDGFEAVSAIKNNPDTATIPIMMYTSQEGELYVGQARALGAVGVLPKQIEPVEVSKVLQSLRVIGSETAQQDNGEMQFRADDSSGEYPGLETLDQDLSLLIQDLFDQQRAVLRRDLLDSYEAIATRVADEIRPQESTSDQEAIEPQVEGWSRLQRIAVIVLAVCSMIFAALYWQREQSWRSTQLELLATQQELSDQRAADVNSSLQVEQRLDSYEQAVTIMITSAVESLEWGANQSTTYAFDELPMGDRRLALVEQLTDRLSALNFSGVIRIESHVGDYCMIASGPDGYQLMPPNAVANACDRIGVSGGEAYELGLRQSVAFANFVRLSEQRSGGKIRYEIISLGNSDPLLAYPASPDDVTAGVWNEIAQTNSRVEINIVQESF